jgi:2-isopropylmalate synthase
MRKGQMVIWEEIARDGAQGETLMSGSQRVHIARAMSKIFGEFAPAHLIFAAGYPAISKFEIEAITQVADEVDTCSLATHGRALRSDIDLGIQTMRRTRFGRVTFAMPSSNQHSEIMMHKSASEVLQISLELSRYALDHADGVPIDIAMGAATTADPIFLAEAAQAFTEEGIATVKICDSMGALYPRQVHRMFKTILERVSSNVMIGAHLHNDMGVAVASCLDTVQLGVRMLSTSWLGIAERAGLPPTEQVIFALANAPETLEERIGLRGPLWSAQPDLTHLVPVAQAVSEMLDIPLKPSDPIVSTIMNHIATGAYFNDPIAFKPFDPQTVLGIPPKLVLTHLANQSIVATLARSLGYELTSEQVATCLAWAKNLAYQRGRSVIPTEEFKEYLHIHMSQTVPGVE